MQTLLPISFFIYCATQPLQITTSNDIGWSSRLNTLGTRNVLTRIRERREWESTLKIDEDRGGCLHGKAHLILGISTSPKNEVSVLLIAINDPQDSFLLQLNVSLLRKSIGGHNVKSARIFTDRCRCPKNCL